MSGSASPPSGAALLRRGLVLLLAGCPGLLSLLPLLPDVPGVPRVALLVQPALLLAALAFAGSWAAARCGFVLAAGPRPAERAAQAALGMLLGAVIALTDHAARGLWQAAPGQPPSVIEGWSVAALPLGLLYGGVVEEVLLRWGAMSLTALALWRLFARHAERPPRWCVTVAIVLAAVLFAASHLPALAAGGITPGVGAALRTLLLNTVAGVAFGLFYARRDLVAAMVAHAAAHLGFAAAALAVAR